MCQLFWIFYYTSSLTATANHTYYYPHFAVYKTKILEGGITQLSCSELPTFAGLLAYNLLLLEN